MRWKIDKFAHLSYLFLVCGVNHLASTFRLINSESERKKLRWLRKLATSFIKTIAWYFHIVDFIEQFWLCFFLLLYVTLVWLERIHNVPIESLQSCLPVNDDTICDTLRTNCSARVYCVQIQYSRVFSIIFFIGDSSLYDFNLTNSDSKTRNSTCYIYNDWIQWMNPNSIKTLL